MSWSQLPSRPFNTVLARQQRHNRVVIPTRVDGDMAELVVPCKVGCRHLPNTHITQRHQLCGCPLTTGTAHAGHVVVGRVQRTTFGLRPWQPVCQVGTHKENWGMLKWIQRTLQRRSVHRRRRPVMHHLLEVGEPGWQTRGTCLECFATLPTESAQMMGCRLSCTSQRW